MTDILSILTTHNPFIGYLIVFALMFIEGPTVTFAAAYLASLGYLNIFIVFFLAILGNLIPDVIVFKLGSFLRIRSIEKAFRYFGLTESRMKKLESASKNHLIKTVILVKTVPQLPIPGLLILGYMKSSFTKFFFTSLILNACYALLIIPLGYFGGLAITNYLHYFNLTKYSVVIAIVIAVTFYTILKISSKIRNRKIKKHKK